MEPICKPTLLIVDDEEELRETLREICSFLPVEILEACDGLQSTQILLSQKVDVVLSDINMPKRSGLEVLEIIRSSGLMTPYLVLSGYKERGVFEKAYEKGATALIEKPFDIDALLSALNLAIQVNAGLRQ